MITRAQAEALLTLAESLEACERVGVELAADETQGCGQLAITTDGSPCYGAEISGRVIRRYVADLIPKHTGS